MEIIKKIELRLKYGKVARKLILKNIREGDVVAEVGVWKGDFSSQLLSTKLRQLYLIDPWKYVENYENSWYGGEKSSQKIMDDVYGGVSERFCKELEVNRIIIIRQESSKGIILLPDSKLDMIYIDGDHTYEAVKQDLELSLQKLKEGGKIAGDDYGVVGWWKDGVKKAVDEFIKNNHQRIKKVEFYGSQFLIHLT